MAKSTRVLLGQMVRQQRRQVRETEAMHRDLVAQTTSIRQEMQANQARTELILDELLQTLQQQGAALSQIQQVMAQQSALLAQIAENTAQRPQLPEA
ncbi:hypothetical protein ACI7RC_25795 [Brevibacillus sp. B_LB10_24]|uniref:hypothetical protein n=1 Tax=Brevibacillus sp. B_LB10_24 TaxID=3380645 RepID=UPI0038B6B839